MDERKIDLLKALGDEADLKRKSGGRGWIYFIALLLLLSGGGFYYWSHKQAAEKTITPPADVAEAETPAAPDFLVASGYVVARRQATIASEITGRIKEVLIEEGMRVEAAQVIALLDDVQATTERDLAAAEWASAKANVVSLEAQQKEALTSTLRFKKLAPMGAVSSSQLQEAEARSDSFAAQIDQAKSAVKAAELEVQRRTQLLAKYTLRAPFAGIVIDKNAQPGEIISPVSAGGGFTRTGIATIVDMDSLEAEVDVNEANIARVAPGQKAMAVLDAYPDWNIPAEVIAVIPTASRDKATIQVRVRLLEKDLRVLPNMAVKVTFEGGAAHGG